MAERDNGDAPAPPGSMPAPRVQRFAPPTPHAEPVRADAPQPPALPGPHRSSATPEPDRHAFEPGAGHLDEAMVQWERYRRRSLSEGQVRTHAEESRLARFGPPAAPVWRAGLVVLVIAAGIALAADAAWAALDRIDPGTSPVDWRAGIEDWLGSAARVGVAIGVGWAVLVIWMLRAHRTASVWRTIRDGQAWVLIGWFVPGLFWYFPPRIILGIARSSGIDVTRSTVAWWMLSHTAIVVGLLGGAIHPDGLNADGGVEAVRAASILLAGSMAMLAAAGAFLISVIVRITAHQRRRVSAIRRAAGDLVAI